MPEQLHKAGDLIAPRSDANKNASDVVSLDFTKVKGRVFTVGDIHGAAAFSDLMKSLNENDRVVFVGDLMDRGENNYENLQKIIADKRFVAVRGNHEESFMRYMQVRRKFRGENDNLDGLLKEHDVSARNYENYLEDSKEPYSNLLNGLDKRERLAYLTFLMNGGSWAEQKKLAELESIENYVDQLPYILEINLSKNEKFLVCHADMSFLSDEEVQEIQTGGPSLSDECKARLTWARAPQENREVERSYDDYEHTRNANSTTVYCGHEITLQGGEVVREDINHVNLDFGACVGAPLVGVEHSNKAMIFGGFEEGYAECSSNKLNKLDKVFNKVNFFNKLFCLHQRMGDIEFTSDKTRDAYYAHLRSKDFSFANRNCSGMDFSGADLTGADLTGAIFDERSKITLDQLKNKETKYIGYVERDENGKENVIYILHSQLNDPEFHSAGNVDANDREPSLSEAEGVVAGGGAAAAGSSNKKLQSTWLSQIADHVKKTISFEKEFIDSLGKSAVFRAATVEKKHQLILTAIKIIQNYLMADNELKDNTLKQRIINSATQRVLALQAYEIMKNAESVVFLRCCATAAIVFVNEGYACVINSQYTDVVRQVNDDIAVWKYRPGIFSSNNNVPKISDNMKNSFLIASFQVQENAKTKKPTHHQQLTFLIDRLDKKLAEYKIRVNQRYKTGDQQNGETHQKMIDAELMKRYLCAMREALFEKEPRQTLADFISETVNKKWDDIHSGNLTSHLTGIPPRPQHTLGSELIAIHDDLKKFVRNVTQKELDDTRTDKNLKQIEFDEKNALTRSPCGTVMPAGHKTSFPAAIAKLALTLATLKQREIEYARRVAVNDLHSGIFSSGISAKDKLMATRDLIKVCKELQAKLQTKLAALEVSITKGSAVSYTVVFDIEFSSENAKAAAMQQSFIPRWREHLGDQYRDIIDAARAVGAGCLKKPEITSASAMVPKPRQ